jgi:sec-independent protein translocase protein TatC
MTLVEHLDELRTRLLRCVGVLLIAVLIAMAFYKDLISLATLPHYRAMCWVGSGARFILLGFGSVGAVMKLSAIVGFFFASPYIARQLWGFVSEGLYRHERRHVAAFAPVSFLLFILGCVFGYFLLLPYALYAMVTMMPLDKIEPVLGIGEYLGFVLTLTIVLGLIFQLPMVMVFLTKVGLVPSRSYRDWRKHAIVANIALAAVLSPPDLMSMAVFALPLLILYELGVWCALWAESRQ